MVKFRFFPSFGGYSWCDRPHHWLTQVRDIAYRPLESIINIDSKESSFYHTYPLAMLELFSLATLFVLVDWEIRRQVDCNLAFECHHYSLPWSTAQSWASVDVTSSDRYLHFRRGASRHGVASIAGWWFRKSAFVLSSVIFYQLWGPFWYLKPLKTDPPI